MTQAGERYWRLHVEYLALSEEQRAGVEGGTNTQVRGALWEGLSEADKNELVERQKAAEGT